MPCFALLVQLDKAIPLLLDMRDDLKEMKGDVKAVRKTTDATLDEIKAVRKTTELDAGRDQRAARRHPAGIC